MSAPRTLSQQEITAFLQIASRDSLALAIAAKTLLLTGLRIAELGHLQWRHVITTHYQPRQSLDLLAEWTKTNQARSVPVPRQLQTVYMEAIETIEAAQGNKPMLHWPLWPGWGEDKYSLRYLQKMVSEAGMEACHRRITPHMLRHTYATGMLRVSNTRVVQIALGHASLRSTQIYTHPSSDDLIEAAAKLWDSLAPNTRLPDRGYYPQEGEQ